MGPCRLLKSREPRLCVSWRRDKSEYYIDGLVVSSEATPHAARWLQTWMRRVFFACACACAPQTLNGTKAPEKPPKPPKAPPDSPNRKPTQYILFFFFWPYFSPRRRWPPEWPGNAIGCTFPLWARLAFYCVTGSRADGKK